MGIWETQELEEMARNSQWEELNEEEPEPELDISEVDSELEEVITGIERAKQNIGEALNLCDGFPVQNDISYILDQLNDIQIDIAKIREEVKSA